MNAMRDLDPYDRWMVKSNVERIRAENEDPATAVKILIANGYPRVAAAVAAEFGIEVEP